MRRVAGEHSGEDRASVTQGTVFLLIQHQPKVPNSRGCFARSTFFQIKRVEGKISECLAHRSIETRSLKQSTGVRSEAGHFKTSHGLGVQVLDVLFQERQRLSLMFTWVAFATYHHGVQSFKLCEEICQSNSRHDAYTHEDARRVSVHQRRGSRGVREQLLNQV